MTKFVFFETRNQVWADIERRGAKVGNKGAQVVDSGMRELEVAHRLQKLAVHGPSNPQKGGEGRSGTALIILCGQEGACPQKGDAPLNSHAFKVGSLLRSIKLLQSRLSIKRIMIKPVDGVVPGGYCSPQSTLHFKRIKTVARMAVSEETSLYLSSNVSLQSPRILCDQVQN